MPDMTRCSRVPHYDLDNPADMQALINAGIIWNSAVPPDGKKQAAEQLASGVNTMTEAAIRNMPPGVEEYIGWLREGRNAL